MRLNRRDFIKASAVMCCAMSNRGANGSEGRLREYHVCLSRRACEENPELLTVVRDAGVTDVWQAAFFYGYWYDTVEGLQKGRAQVESLGLRWHPINVPLGHPGDALGDASGQTPLTPPARWKMAERFDGGKHSGTSLHDPGTAENVAAVQALAALEPDILFLDDDFRLAVGPGIIGGCFCCEHRAQFLQATGFAESVRAELLDMSVGRRLARVLWSRV